VVHYDLPETHKDYTHRSGRTGRAGARGTVVALVGNDQIRDAQKLARQVGIVVDITGPDFKLLTESDGTAPILSPDAAPAPASKPPHGGRGRNNSGSGNSSSSRRPRRRR
jgi:superfamily II DNA/RNA helicase